ncbi:TonB-dependent receptor [Jeongeupia naejangsanensis]|uniref:TonB-dependent receptor n=1 Tax=Jeongeupia naejangsanensis TaxID=613195 RepID=A0ABS2BKM9_9NEIS|nr:TonB-dependent receptor [Jeongeupia naejangsanensis]MBM3116172.1 TonB-dependent receptor [Jeongeupia naejangsanensis]
MLDPHRPLRARPLTPLLAAFTLAFSPAALADDRKTESTLSPLVVTANPLGSGDLAVPVTQLAGDALLLRDAGTLGEVLTGLPGVASTSFGPGASRPVIRGLDGDRILLLQNGTGALDASALSYDHAVAQDVAVAERIEIVRGPAALLYGGNAIGGVVNTLDNRIPSAQVDGVSGAARLEYGGAANERVAGARVDAGNGDYAVHVDLFGRRSDDLRIPGYAWSDRQRAGQGSYQPPQHEHGHEEGEHGHEAPEPESPYGRLPNSDSRAHGGAFGVSRTWDDGHLGFAYSGYRSNYGSVAEEDVRLDLKQDRFSLAFAKNGLAGPFTGIKADLAYTDYDHQELHGSEVGTTFGNRGYDARIEGRHAAVGALTGVVGVQFGQTRFSALGEEAFVPNTETQKIALFVLEQWQAATAQFSVGGRIDYSSLSPNASDNRRFKNSESRSFTAGSLSAGVVQPLAGGWSLAGNAAYTERAPSQYELYANGEHVATGTFERGDPDAGKEKAGSLDAALRYQAGADRLSLGGYYSHFANFIALERTGRWCHSHGDHDHCGKVQREGESPEYAYEGVPAKLYGFELDSNWRVYQHAAQSLDLQLWGDVTRAEQRNTGEPLPRIPPMRVAGAIVYGWGALSLRAELQHAAEQDRVPRNDTPSDAYTVANVALSYRVRHGATDWTAYLRGDNLGNEEIRYASSLTRDIAPQGRRSARAGLAVQF